MKVTSVLLFLKTYTYNLHVTSICSECVLTLTYQQSQYWWAHEFYSYRRISGNLSLIEEEESFSVGSLSGFS